MTKKKIKFNPLVWLSNNLLLIFSGFLIIFIPLYPKLPLFEAIPGYIVRVRLEDIFVFLATFIWLIKAIKNKIKWNSPILWLIISYLIAAVLSVISAVIISKTVPVDFADKDFIHLAKTLLHLFRYMEYFALFFIVSSSIKTKKDFKILLATMILTLLGVSIYGIGQKYLYWPVYSTMNREFSKGLRLYLTPHARVQSTFGGHYDFAAYLVLILNLVIALFYKIKNRWQKIGLFIIYLLGLWSLIVSASRTSFVAFCAGLLFILIHISSKETNFTKKLKLFIKKSFVQLLIFIVMFFYFGDDMYERFLQSIAAYPEIHEGYHKFNDNCKKTKNSILVSLGLKIELPKAEIPENAISTDDLAQKIVVASDTRPSSQKPLDVYVDVPNLIQVATISASGSATTIMVETERTWSDNALRHGLSLAIRLDELWPRAIQGFLKNPLLGTGYATLTKKDNVQFTEAESTDNNFLRTLGETGLLGFISFYSVVILSMTIAAKFLKSKDQLTSAVSLGFLAASIGLLLNALYIDVFAASKVAFTYWAFTGLLFGLVCLNKNYKKLKVIAWWQKQNQKLQNKLHNVHTKNK